MFKNFVPLLGRALRQRAWLVLLLALPTGCLPESHEPVTPVDQAVEEPGLIGLWGAAIEDGAVYVHVRRGEGPALQVVMISQEPDGSGEVDTYDAHVSAVGQARFVNLIESGSATSNAISGSTAPYLLVGYELPSADLLTIKFLGEQPVADAIARGDLTGEMDDAGEGVSIVITDKSERIAAFLASADPATLFDRNFIFHRLSPPRP